MSIEVVCLCIQHSAVNAYVVQMGQHITCHAALGFLHHAGAANGIHLAHSLTSCCVQQYELISQCRNTHTFFRERALPHIRPEKLIKNHTILYLPSVICSQCGACSK